MNRPPDLSGPAFFSPFQRGAFICKGFTEFSEGLTRARTRANQSEGEEIAWRI